MNEMTFKLFISYCHADNIDGKKHVGNFKKHLSPLRDQGLIKDWYDREIVGGDDYQKKIDNSLESADIICLFLSANFFNSESCKKEKDKAVELMITKGVTVIPIILSKCGWLEYPDISNLLALPTDGIEISSFDNEDDAWHEVCLGLKKVIEKRKVISRLSLNDVFNSFLEDTEMLGVAHQAKKKVCLNDIFVFPDLEHYDSTREYSKTINSKILLDELSSYHRIAIAGEDQSGKTSLCKMIIKELLCRNFVPIYITGKENNIKGVLYNRVNEAFKNSYNDTDIANYDVIEDRVVLIIDDLHYINNKQKVMNQILKYKRSIIVVDDIFSLNIQDEKLITVFDYFKIKEYRPSLRDELIRKWIFLSDKVNSDNETYKEIDQRTALLNNTLGRVFGRGIMPAYPFFIISALITYETFSMPLNQDITSQGYCYQALIYYYLRKQGVDNDEIDIYVNFLTEVAYYVYKEKKNYLTSDDFDGFMVIYINKYNLPFNKEKLLDNLTHIFSANNFLNYSFKHLYLFYFFVAKYLAEQGEKAAIKSIISDVLCNLHIDENAYIAIFLAHHSKNISILDEITLNAMCMFDHYQPPVTLSKSDVEFFDKQSDVIIKAVLPPSNITPESERAKLLELEDKLEEEQDDNDQEESSESLVNDLRKAIKTVEAMGCIIKNRSGSLEKDKLKEIFIEGMNLHLRILRAFFNTFDNEEKQKYIIEYVSYRLKKTIQKENLELNDDELEVLARTIFWNLNFLVVRGITYKIIHSLGSDKLVGVITDACDELDTPISFIIKHGIIMWSKKNLHIDVVSKKINDKEFSALGKRAMEMLIINHVTLHSIDYKERQKIASIFGFSAKKLLIEKSKGQDS